MYAIEVTLAVTDPRCLPATLMFTINSNIYFSVAQMTPVIFFSVLPCSCDLKTENRFINA